MALSNFNDRVDEQDKTVFRKKRTSFEIKQEDSFFDTSNQAYILKSVKELQDGKGTAHELIEDDDEQLVNLELIKMVSERQSRDSGISYTQEEIMTDCDISEKDLEGWEYIDIQ